MKGVTNGCKTPLILNPGRHEAPVSVLWRRWDTKWAELLGRYLAHEQATSDSIPRWVGRLPLAAKFGPSLMVKRRELEAEHSYRPTSSADAKNECGAISMWGEGAARTFAPGPWIMGTPHTLSFNLKKNCNKCGSGQGPEEDSCEHGHVHSSSIKY
jgi:hypothetical protein